MIQCIPLQLGCMYFGDILLAIIFRKLGDLMTQKITEVATFAPQFITN